MRLNQAQEDNMAQAIELQASSDSLTDIHLAI
jgi:hypothetical protein